MGNYKDKNGKSRAGVWLGKVKNAFPDIASEVVDVMTGESPLKSVVDLVKKRTQNDDKSESLNAEKLLLQYEFERSQMEHESKMFGLEVDDRKDARTNGDQHLQRIVAYFSLIGFSVFSLINIWLAFEILQNEMVVNEFIIMTTSNMNGIFTGLLFTLKDFLFGGSSKNENK